MEIQGALQFPSYIPTYPYNPHSKKRHSPLQPLMIPVNAYNFDEYLKTIKPLTSSAEGRSSGHVADLSLAELVLTVVSHLGSAQ